jgi:hypothetical protein
MKLNVVETAAIHAPAAQVKAYIANLNNLQAWDTSTRRVRLVRAGDAAKPAVFDVDIDFSLFGGCCLCRPCAIGSTRITYEVLPSNSRRLVMNGTGAGVRTTETYSFRSVGSTTELTYGVRVDVQGWRTVFAPCISVRTRFLAQKALRKLEELDLNVFV